MTCLQLRLNLTNKLTLQGQILSLLDEEFGISGVDLRLYDLLIAYKNKKLYGVVVYKEYNTEIDIQWIAVDRYYRGKGIGSTLISKLVDKALKYNKNIILTPAKSNEVINFYIKNGFKFINDSSNMIYEPKVI